ncbi:MAG TPA: GspE/PulE family protein [Candidatus Acidoferrum sp.]|nr:GspE/PulE family protein [Candidatus Acidoferrum sp.]
MYPSIDKIKAILLRESYISEADSQKAEAEAHDSEGYIDFLIRAELLSKPLLGQALAESYKLPYVDLGSNPTTKENVNLIPEATARASRVVFVKASDKIAAVATDQPEAVKLDELAQFFPGKKVRLAYALPEHIEASFRLYEQPLETRFSQIIEAGKRVAPEIVDEIIKDALSYRASDIHFEPQVSDVMVRFRVDGNLREAGKLPKENYENILNRIKVESGMRIDEHFTAQDGSLQRKAGEQAVDLRVSLVPTVEGEKVVMRVLGSYVQGFALADIGLDEAHHQLLETYAAKPFGMILTVGPTGSGKTTTLYSLLKLLNRPNVNITSIEDPVEYKMQRVNQIQVREQVGLTFAKGLRAIVRQDPDIILVGEIRDQETADISVNAALTGHLLLSTFHANDAATAVPRLIDMGIEPFLLASTLEVIIAQRLVRKICAHCRYSLPTSEALKGLKVNVAEITAYLGKTDTVYAGKGCNVCSGTGYNGRTALFEFLEVIPQMQDLIIKSPSVRDIEALAHSQGARPMFEDGMEKVKTGLTTVAEVVRVVAPPRKAT